jgi:hypothetical protein
MPQTIEISRAIEIVEMFRLLPAPKDPVTGRRKSTAASRVTAVNNTVQLIRCMLEIERKKSR